LYLFLLQNIHHGWRIFCNILVFSSWCLFFKTLSSHIICENNPFFIYFIYNDFVRRVSRHYGHNGEKEKMTANITFISYGKFSKTLLLFFFLPGLIWLGGCDKGENQTEVAIQLTPPARTYVPANPAQTKTPLKIAVAAIISPRETFSTYKGILDYISRQLGTPVELVQRGTYEEVNQMVRQDQVVAAFVCSGAYVEGHKQFGMELLVAPQAYGDTVYYSYIIVHKNSEVHSLKDLKDRTFAFTDPMSNTGKRAPTYMLTQMGQDPETFFSKTIFTYSHDNSIMAVAKKIVDGAAVDSLVWDYLDAKKPENTSQTRIIKKSEPYGIPPVVVSKNLDPALKKELKKILLGMHNNNVGKEIMHEIMIDRFVEVNDSLYDSIKKTAP